MSMLDKIQEYQQKSSGYPELDYFGQLTAIDDKVGDKYDYPFKDGGDEYFTVLYINGSIIDDGFIHKELMKKYNETKELYKNEWNKDVTNIELNTDTILANNIPCARIVLDNSHKIAQILVSVNCDINTVSNALKQKYNCKVYLHSPNEGILMRTANK